METLQKWLKGLGQDYSLGELKALKRLEVRCTQVTSVPKEIVLLSNLLILIIDNNYQLTCVPKEIGLLHNLECLGLDSNQLTSIPKEIGLLSNLIDLYLENNHLKTIPNEICELSGLNRLYFSNNPGISLYTDQVEFIRPRLFRTDHTNNYNVIPRSSNTNILFG